jgi:hypothetical protein
VARPDPQSIKLPVRASEMQTEIGLTASLLYCAGD